MSRRRDETVDMMANASLGSREGEFVARTPEFIRQRKQKSGREFAPLLYSVKQSRTAPTPKDKGVLSFDEGSDSMESFARASFINSDKDMQKKMSQFKENNAFVHQDVNSMPLREQEKAFDELQKNNWRLKMTIMLLQEKLSAGISENQAQTQRENIDLKAELQTLKAERAMSNGKEDGREVEMYKEKVEKLEARVEELQNDSRDQQRIEQLEATIEQLEGKVEDLEYEGRRADEEKQRLEQLLEEQPEERPEERHEERDEELWQAKSDLAMKQQEIDELHYTSQTQQERIQQLQQEKRQLEDNNNDDQLFEAQQEKRVLQRELDDYNDKLATAQQERDAAQQELKLSKRDQLESQDELANVKLLLNRCNNDVLSLTNEKHELERQIADLKSQENQTRIFDESMSERRTGELERVRQELRQKEDELATARGEMKQEKEHLESKLQSTERLKENVERQLENALQDKTRDTLQNAIDVEKSNHQEVKRSLEREIEQLQTTVKNLRQEVETLKQRHDEVKTKMEKMQSEMNDLDDDLVVSQNQLDQVTHAKDSLQGQLQGLQTSYQSQENTLNALRDINKREVDSRIEAEQQRDRFQTQSQTLTNEYNQLKEQKRSLEIQVETLQQKYDRVSQRLANTTEACNETRTQLERAEMTTSNDSMKRILQKYEYDLKYYREVASRQKRRVDELKRELKQVPTTVEMIPERTKEQMRYLRDRLIRESSCRFDLMFMKRFFLLKISSYQACNRADLRLLQDIGIYPDYSRIKPRTARDKLQSGVLAVMAVVRISNRHAACQQEKNRRAKLRK